MRVREWRRLLSGCWHAPLIGMTSLVLGASMLLAACASPATCATHVSVVPPPQLSLRDGVLYAAGQHVAAWDAATGTLLWQTTPPVAADIGLSMPVVAGGVVYVATSDSMVLAWRATTGALLWRSRPVRATQAALHGAVPPPVIVGGVVYAGAGWGAIAAWRTRDGALLWQSSAVALSPARATVTEPVPVVAGGAVYYTAANVVVALRARDGQRLWEADAPLSGTRFAAPVVIGDVVCVGASDGTVYAFAAATGRLTWRAHAVAVPSIGPGGAPSVFAAGATMYVSTQDGWVMALAATNGVVHWRAQIPGTGPFLPAQLVGTVLYAGSDAGVYAFNAANGQVVWQAAVHLGQQGSALSVTSDTLFASGAGNLFAWRARDGGFLWQIALSPPSATVPLGAADGLVYVGLPGATSTCRQPASATRVVALWSDDGSVLWRADA